MQAWVGRQHPAVEVAAAMASGSVQGGFLGGGMGKISEMQPAPAAGQAASPMAMQVAKAGGAVAQARNFAVLTGVHAGISVAMKKARGGVEDVKNTMAASFGAGVCFNLVSGGSPGQNLVASCLTTGFVFALLQGGFYKLGKAFTGKGKKGAPAKGARKIDEAYYRTDIMLEGLGLIQYSQNFRNGMLGDQTLPLLTDSALKDCSVPPGPRLLILDHIGNNRKFYVDDLKARAKLAAERAKYT